MKVSGINQNEVTLGKGNVDSIPTMCVPIDRMAKAFESAFFVILSET